MKIKYEAHMKAHGATMWDPKWNLFSNNVRRERGRERGRERRERRGNNYLQ
jgi:hypothetical protein